MRRVLFCVVLLTVLPSLAQAEKRIALLIGNQSYTSEIGALRNPHNDVALLERVLRSLGFDVSTVRDVGLAGLHQAVNSYTRRLREAGPGSIGFFYYAGHGAADAGINYLIPVDVKTAETSQLWDQSLRLTDITRSLRDQAGNAIHFVVFDACRNNLKLKDSRTRAIVQSRGFVPVAHETGMLIAYSTAQGELASDVGIGAGTYASALAEEIVKPGVEAVPMFRSVQLRVRSKIKQEPWLTFSAIGEVHFARGQAPVAPPITATPPSAPTGAEQRRLSLETWRAEEKRNEGDVQDKISLSTDMALLRDVSLWAQSKILQETARRRLEDIYKAQVTYQGMVNSLRTEDRPWKLDAAERIALLTRFRNLLERAQKIGPQGDKKKTEIQTYLGFDESFANSRCRHDPKFRAIWTMRSRISRFIHRAEIHRDQKEFEDITLVRRADILHAWFDVIKASKLLKGPLNRDVRTLLAELLAYREKIVNTPDWETKIKEIYLLSLIGNHMTSGLVNGMPFHERGFARPSGSDICMLEADYTNATIDTWLYSFWMRRYMENTMGLAHNAIQWALTLIK